MAFTPSGSNYLTRAANLPNTDAGTICFWLWQDNGDTGDWQVPLSVVSTAAGSCRCTIKWYSAYTYRLTADGADTDLRAAFDAQTWYFAFLRWSSTTVSADVLAAGDGFASHASSWAPSTTQAIDTQQFGRQTAALYWSGRLAAFKMWNVVLTDEELGQERLYYNAQKTANLLMCTPLKTDTQDNSGAGHHWTENGTISYAAGPTIDDDPAAPGGSPGSITTTITL